MEVEPIRTKMKQAVSDGVFPGAVLLCAKDDRVCFHEAFGTTDLFSGTQVSKKSIFDLASLTKPLATALCIERLMGIYPDLINEKIGTVLELFSGTDKAGITIDMLLRHTSGYPSYREYFRQISAAGSNPGETLVRLLVEERLEHPSGTNEVYSDLGYMVLRFVIEKLSDMPLDRFAKKSVFDPLGIDRLFFIPKQEKKDVLQRYGNDIVPTQECKWRGRLLRGEVDDENAWAVGGVDGHAGLFADVQSVYLLCRKILSALNNEKRSFFNPIIIRDMVLKKEGFTRVAGFDTPAKLNASTGSGFSPETIGHLGFTGTSFWIDPAVGLIAILLTNRIHPSRSNLKIRKFRPEIHDLIASQLL